MKKLSYEFYSTLDSLMILLDYSYNPIHHKEFCEQMIMRELGKLHYLYIRDTESAKQVFNKDEDIIFDKSGDNNGR